jgi:phosphocarrier protein HPr
MQDGEWFVGTAVIPTPTGLHARPAVKLTKLAKTFESAVEIRTDHGTAWISAKSPNAVMKLRAAHGVPLHIRAAGADAKAAVDAIVTLVSRNFND